MESTRDKRICAILSIVISLCNLAEQLGIYFAQKASVSDDTTEHRFFYILFGITGINLFKAFFSTKRWQLSVSLAAEIVQLICYLAVLGITTSIVAVSVVFFVLELVFHLVCIYLNDDKEPKTIWKKVSVFAVQLFIYIAINVGSFLTLFLSSDSKFHQPVYEVSLIFSLFFAGVIMEVLNLVSSDIQLMKTKYEAGPGQDDDSEAGFADFGDTLMQKHIIERFWTILNMLMIVVFVSLFFSILTIVLASLEIKEHGNMLQSYDHGLYIYLLIYYSLTLLLSPCCTLCGGILCAMYFISGRIFE